MGKKEKEKEVDSAGVQDTARHNYAGKGALVNIFLRSCNWNQLMGAGTCGKQGKG